MLQNAKQVLVVLFIISVLVIGIAGRETFASSHHLKASEKIVQNMMEKYSKINSLEYSGELKAQTKGHDASNFVLNFNGMSDDKDVKNIKGVLSLNIAADQASRGESADEPTKKKFNLGLDIRFVNKIVYVRLNNIDIPSFGKSKDKEISEITSLKNQWIKIDIEALAKSPELKELGLDIKFKEAEKQTELSPERVKKLEEVFKQARIFKVVKRFSDKTINNIPTYHFKFEFDKNGIIELIAGISEVMFDKESGEAKMERGEMLKVYSRNFQDIKLPKGEIWIGKKDLLPHKIYFGVRPKVAVKSELSTRYDFTLLFKNFNKPVQVDVPANTKSLEDIIGPKLADARQKSRDAKRVADMKQLQTALELYFTEKNDYPPTAVIDDGDPKNTPLKLSTGNGFSTVASGTTNMEFVPENPQPNGIPYVYNRLSPTDFTIDFSLEKGFGNLSAGHHVTTSGGIR